MNQIKAYVGFIDISNVLDKPGIPFGWRVIAKWQRSPIIHCFMAYGNGITDPPDVYETTETIFQKRTLWDRIAGTPCVLFEVLEGDAAFMLTHSRSLMGQPYDYTAIAGLGVVLALEHATHWIFEQINKLLVKCNIPPLNDDYQFTFIGNPFHMSLAGFCSETVEATLRAGGAKLPEWWVAESTMPRQLFRWCMWEGSQWYKIAYCYGDLPSAYATNVEVKSENS